MEETINFGDNLFYLKLKLKLLADSSKLDLSDELFQEQIINEIESCGKNTEWLHKAIESKPKLITRNQHLLDLSRIMRIFSELVNNLSNIGRLDSHIQKKALEENARSMNFTGTEILHMIDTSGNDLESKDSMEIISNSELEFLLNNEESDTI